MKTVARILVLMIFLGTPIAMIFAAGFNEGWWFFGSWIGGSLIGGLLAAYIDSYPEATTCP